MYIIPQAENRRLGHLTVRHKILHGLCAQKMKSHHCKAVATIVTAAALSATVTTLNSKRVGR